MGEQVFSTGKVSLSRYTGPATEGADRRRWQLTVHQVARVQMDYEEFCAFASGVLVEYATCRTAQFEALLEEAKALNDARRGDGSRAD